MSDSKLRAWWAHRQALDGRMSVANPSAVLAETGWARSLGGVGPYLTLFSRAGITREAADRAVEALEIHELPSARNCTYVVPAADFALALKSGQGFDGEIKLAAKLGVTAREIEKLCAAVVDSLSAQPLDPAELREALGPAVRSLGEVGKKKGLSTTLPVALGKLQSEGEIRRVPINGRLDQQRYKYCVWKRNPLDGFKLSVEECYVELARRFFTWIGPATLPQFQTFAGLGVKASKLAVEPLKLESLPDDRLILPALRDAWENFKPSKASQYHLISLVDSLVLLPNNIQELLDPADHDREVPTDKGLKPIGHLTELASHTIVDRGTIIGMWEFDLETNSIAWICFRKVDTVLKRVMTQMEQYIRDQLGDARSFSLDSPKSRAPRIAALRAWGK